MDKAPVMESMDALQDLLEGRNSNCLRREKFGERGAGERGGYYGKPLWPCFEVIALILLICRTCKLCILALVLDVPESKDLRL